ncbi:hypothetical protein DBR06_SOUSAS11910026, partial [Sousa chinensis]
VTSLLVHWVRLHFPNAGGLGLIPGWEIRSCMHAATKSAQPQLRIHMPQLRIHMSQLRSPHATTKDPACCN